MSEKEVGLKTWTEEEEKLLLQHFYYYSDNELHDLFLPNKTPKSIERKIFRMNLGAKSPEVKKRGIEKMSNTKKEYYKTHDGINKGKIFSEDTRKKMSNAKKAVNKWKGEDNPRHQKPLFGKDNGNWQGGITDLYRALRNELNLWYTDSIAACGYKCIITGEHFEDVHHFYAFQKIMKETFDNIGLDMRSSAQDYTEEQWNNICKELIYLHQLYGLGICLTKPIHKLFHENYTYHYCTPQNFLDFIYRLDCGEFDNWLNRNNIELNINYEYIEYLESTLPFSESA